MSTTDHDPIVMSDDDWSGYMDALYGPAVKRPGADEQKIDDAFAVLTGVEGPRFLVSGHDGLSEEEVDKRIQAAFKQRPLFLSDLRAARAGGRVRPMPEVGIFVDAEGNECGAMFYKGKSHSISGEGGKGKSLLVQRIGFDHARRGGTFLMIDYEKGPDNFEDRAFLLDVDEDTASRVAYWSRPGALTGAVLNTVIRFAVMYSIDFVVIDSVSRSMTSFGRNWSENDNNHVRDWYQAAIDPLIQAGLTVVVIDHLVKPSNEKHASAARYAKGAADKLNVIDGIAYVVETVEPFSAKQAGYMRAVTAKENNGAYTEGQVVAEFHVNPVNDGNLIESRLCAPGKPAMPAKDGGFRPTGYMEKVSVFLEAQTEPVSKADVQRALGGDANMVARAIDVLGMELYANVKKQGPGKATLCSSVKSFRVATDPGPTPMSEPEYF